MNLFNKLTKRNSSEDEVNEVSMETPELNEEETVVSPQTEPETRPKSEEIASVHDYFEPLNYNNTPVSYETQEEPSVPSEHQDKQDRKMMLLKPWNIVWSWVVMSIPVIGWIFAILWALGVCRTRQKKFLARAFIIISLMTLVFYTIAYAFYTLVFRLELNDLPTVLASIYNWLWNLIASIFNK